MTHTFQFGASNKPPVLGWTIVLLYPSFQDEESWRLMEKAAVIQGDLSYWKAAYRWGGAPYHGVTATSRALDSSFPNNTVEFSHTGGLLTTNTVLW